MSWKRPVHESTSPTRVSSTLRFFFGRSGSFVLSPGAEVGLTLCAEALSPPSVTEEATEAAEADPGTALVLTIVALEDDSGMLARGADVELDEAGEGAGGFSVLGSGALRLAGVGEGVTCADAWLDPTPVPIEVEEWECEWEWEWEC